MPMFLVSVECPEAAQEVRRMLEQENASVRPVPIEEVLDLAEHAPDKVSKLLPNGQPLKEYEIEYDRGIMEWYRSRLGWEPQLEDELGDEDLDKQGKEALEGLRYGVMVSFIFGLLAMMFYSSGTFGAMEALSTTLLGTAVAVLGGILVASFNQSCLETTIH